MLRRGKGGCGEEWQFHVQASGQLLVGPRAQYGNKDAHHTSLFADFVLRPSHLHSERRDLLFTMPAAAPLKTNKKRLAPTQAGPKSKKAHVEKTAELKAAKRRSRPVTAVMPHDSDATSEDDSEEDQPDGGQEELEEGDRMDASEIPKNPNCASHPPSFFLSFIDTRPVDIAARESHKAQRALHEQRKAAKPHSTLLTEAKQAWTLARQKNLSKQERTKHINALMDIIRGKVKDIVFKHDASRIVQTVVKWGGQKARNEIAEELKGNYRELAQSKYSKVRPTSSSPCFVPPQR